MNIRTLLFSLTTLINTISVAQTNNQDCKVLLTTINQSYNGECKKGLANGKGEATGLHKYSGVFKNGAPNGNGIYSFSDSVYYVGSFLDGLKEGKGEMHDHRSGAADTLIKGYWSGGEYRGKTYVTYISDVLYKFDRVDISPTKESGNRISIEISTTSGTPNDQLNAYSGTVVSLVELVSMENNSLIKFLSDFQSATKATWVFEITKFPIKLRGRLSNGQNFNLELFKAANWTVRLFLNK